MRTPSEAGKATLLVKDGLEAPPVREAVAGGRSRFLEIREESVLASARIVRGLKAILDLQPALMGLAERTAQTGMMDDLRYFLTLPQSQPKEPVLVLLGSQRTEVDRVDGSRFSERNDAADLAAAVLRFEYRVAGLGCRVYSTADWTGRRTVLATPGMRAQAAAAASSALLGEGAQICLITFQPGRELTEVPADGIGPGLLEEGIRRELAGNKAARWALERRQVPIYLPMESSFDATLAKIGQRTRSNMRYYRRRGERDLQSFFVADAQLALDEFLAFNRECKYAVPEDLARWRFASIAYLRDPFLHGIRDGAGRWLALVCGRRLNGGVEIDWQLNRADLPTYSLSTVMRAYLMEYELARGAKRLSIEGGTPSAIQKSFGREDAFDLTVVRRSIYTRAIRRLSPKNRFPKNHLSQVIADPELVWHHA